MILGLKRYGFVSILKGKGRKSGISDGVPVPSGCHDAMMELWGGEEANECHCETKEKHESTSKPWGIDPADFPSVLGLRECLRLRGEVQNPLHCSYSRRLTLQLHRLEKEALGEDADRMLGLGRAHYGVPRVVK